MRLEHKWAIEKEGKLSPTIKRLSFSKHGAACANTACAERLGRPKTKNLSVLHKSAVPRTVGYNRRAISTDAGRPGARKSHDESHLGKT
jgi:hypothetical protein